jgi:plasmid stabilization system protein ParE
LDEAVAFVARDSPKRAEILPGRVLDAAESLSDLSERGSAVPEIAEPDVRQLLPEPYRLIYRVERDQVTVLAVIHQRKDVGLWARSRSR